MMGLYQNEREQMGPLGVIAALERAAAEFGDNAEVWQGDACDWVIGAMPDPEDGEYEMIATVGELLAEYREGAQ